MGKMRKKLRVGIVGAGMISQFHIAGWKSIYEAEIVAICDPDPQRLHSGAELIGATSTYRNVDDMAKDNALDIIDIVTPVDSHVELVKWAADNNVHAMCQKPIARNSSVADELIRYVGNRVRVMVHENYRFRPHYLAIRKLVAQGRLGDIEHARMTMRCSGMCNGSGGSQPFLLSRQPYLAHMPRLVIFETLIHHFDVLRAILGELKVESCHLNRLNRHLSGEDTAHIVVRNSKGTLASIDGSYSARGYPALPSDALEIIGSKRSLTFAHDTLTVLGDGSEVTQFDLAGQYQACFTTAIRHFIDCLILDQPFETGLVSNVETLRLVDDCYRIAGVDQ
jgi:predicted dehydrogenase